MPTTYTHWRFGNECKKQLPDKLKNIVDEYRDIYNFGVQGPDIYFYYKCAKHNAINEFGEEMHKRPYKDILAEIKVNYAKSENKELLLAYILGFTAHFDLDSHCHSYIEAKTKKSGISHYKIESQLDRYYLEKDGYNPIKYRGYDTLKPSAEVVKGIQETFPALDIETTRKALKDMVFYLNFLKDSSDLKRTLVSLFLKKMGGTKFIDLFVTKTNIDECKDSNIRNDRLYAKALKKYLELANDVYGFLEEDKELGEYFNNHFGQRDDYMDIEILSYEDELKNTNV